MQLVRFLILSSLLLSCVQKNASVKNPPATVTSGGGRTSIVGTGPVVANNVATSSITITLVDDNGNPFTGVVPRFDATNSGSTNTYGTCSATNSSGVSTCTLKSKKAETKTLRITSPVTYAGGDVVFTYGPAAKVGLGTQPSSSVLVSADLATSPVFQIQDQYGNAVLNSTATITISAFTNSTCTSAAGGTMNADNLSLALDGLSGGVTFTGINYSKWEDLYIKGSSPGYTDGCSNKIQVRQVVSAANSTITGTGPITADGVVSSTISIHLEDTLANPIFGATPTFSATNTGSTNVYGACAPTDAGGNSICLLSSTKAETKTLSLVSPVTKVGPTVDFVAGAAVAATSSISGTSNIIANGAATSAITIYIKDLFSNGVSGITPTFSATDTGATNVYGGCSITDATGLSTCTLMSTKAETKALQLTFPFAKVGNSPIFTNGPLATLTFVTQPTATTFTDIALDTQPVVEAMDANGNLITTSSLPITLSPMTDAACNTAAGGTLTATTNPVSTNTTTGRSTFAGVKYNTAGALYLKAGNGAIKGCSNLITVTQRPEITYSTATINEAASNIGQITQTITVTLTDDTFTGVNGDNLVALGKLAVTNLPAGLTLIANRDSATALTLSFTGSATNHANANDISNLTLVFANSAFTAGRAADVINYSKNDFVINFTDPFTLTYASSSFTETIANTGTTSDTATITLAGTTFTGADSDDFVAAGKIFATNLPAGMTLVATRNNATTIVLSITGSATLHANANDVSNLTITFNDTSFSSGEADGVSNSVKNNLTIDFADPATLTYSGATFTETLGNTGATTDTLTITLAGDTFVADITGLISTTNLPAGLTANFTRNSATEIGVSITGNAALHANANDVSNLTFTFATAIFTNNGNAANVVNYNKSDIVIDFTDPATLTYDKTTLNEPLTNTGALTGESFVITLSGDTFVADLTGKIVASNVPAGLTAVFTRDSGTQLTVTFTGNAALHANANDVSNLTITFLNAAFTNNTFASNVVNYAKNDLVINFFDPPALSYSAALFNEASPNDGSITEFITITLTNDYLSTPLAGVTASNVPGGLTASFVRMSDTEVRMLLTGNAVLHADANDISNLTVTFANSAFQNAAAAIVTNSTKSDLVINYSDPATLSYSLTTFNEVVANTGAINETLTITLAGDTFQADLTGDISVTNVPAGLTAVVTRTSATTVTVNFTGSATNHANVNDIGNLTVTFSDNAFSNVAAANVVDATKSDITIDFDDQGSLAYSTGTLNEAASNTGAITETVVITLSNDTFVADLTGKVSATNTPAGLTAVFTRDNATQVTLSFTASATNHANVNDIANLTVTFADGAFTNTATASNVTNYTKNNIAVNFIDPASLAYSATTLNESVANTGAITETIVITLTNDTFVANLTGTYNVSNLPAGLSATLTRDSATQATLSLTGNSAAHANANDTSSVQLTFLATAFTNNTVAANVVNYQQSLTINFIDPASLAYSTGTLTESATNVGAITQTITITLTGDTFPIGMLPTDLTYTNTPAGLSATYTRDSATQLTISLSGNAAAHANANDIANFTITFGNGSFTNNLAANVVNYLKNDITIDFADPATLSYSGATFNEVAANNGAIQETVTITLAGDTFPADLTGDITVTNVPAGLTAVVTRTSGTTVTLNFTGNAASHANANDIGNLTVTFSNNAFTSSLAAGVTNATKSDLIIDFDDQGSLAYSTGTLNEAASNTGAITETIVITLTNDTFIANLTGTYTASNIPAGLTANFTRDSATQVTVTLTGNAAAHANVNDIANLTITFLDGAFTNTATASNVTNYTKNNIVVNFIDPASLTHSTTTLNESAANTGAITETITITLTGDTWAADLTGDYTVAGLPLNFTATLTRNSDTVATLAINGTAASHDNTDDTTFTLEFLAAAFTSNTVAANVTDYQKVISINYNAPASLSYSTSTVTETAANTGAISQTIIVTLTGDTFPVGILPTDVTFTNTPLGLSPSFTRDSATQITVTFAGNATNHASANDIANFTITFGNGAFTNNAANNVTNYIKNNITVDFADPASIAYSGGTLLESVGNDGSITGSLTLTLTGDTWANDLTGDYTISNVPTGLTAQLTRDSDSQLTLSFTGNATSHANANDVGNITLTFLASAFTNNTVAANVTNYTKNNIALNFSDPASLSYASSTFTESSANNGQIGNSIVITLSGDTFIADLTGKIIVSNLPAGLSASAARDSGVQVTLSLTGTATDHSNANDIANLTVTFQNGAFTNTAVATNVTNYAKSDIIVNFSDPATLTYSTGTFSEGQSLVYDAYTVSIYHMNGSIGPISTATDDYVNLLDLAFINATNPAYSDAQSKFGGVSLAMNGDIIETATSSYLQMTDFTAEGWVYFSAIGAGSEIIGISSVDDGWQLLANNDGSVTLDRRSLGTVNSLGGIVSVSTWHNFAVVQSGTITSVYLDGISVIDTSLGADWDGGTHLLTLGGDTFTGSAGIFDGYIDEVRISNIARYSGNFAPSASQFGTPAFVGKIGNSATITLANGTFTGSNGDNFVSAGKVTVTNLPAGLTAVVSRASNTQVTVTLTGAATNHANANDISNLSLQFEDTAFSGGLTSGSVTNSNKTNLIVDFVD